MDMGSVFSLLGSQQSSVVHTEKKKQAALALKTEAQGDRVTISEEARSLLARATKHMKGAENSSTPQEESADSAASPLESTAEQTAEQASESSAATEESNAEKMRELERKLKELCAQYQAVMESSAPEIVKEVQGKVIKQKIDDLMNQLGAMREQNIQTSIEQNSKPKS